MSSPRGSSWIGALRAALFAALAIPTAHAQWNVVQLHTASSFSFGVRNGQVAGEIGGSAGWWDIATLAFVPLASPTTPSYALATDGVHQVGTSNDRAALWSGTAASLVDLDPALPGGLGSFAQGVQGGIQVGATRGPSFTYVTHAAMWTGSAASYVDLNPPGSTSSSASDLDGGQIVGGATIAGISHAGFWTGTAASFVSLNPPGGVDNAYCFGVHAGRQVGYIAPHSQPARASLWSSTPASWIDLSLPALFPSWANKVAVSPAGVPYVAGQAGDRASFWNDTASSWTDLQLYLPSDTVRSEALGVWIDTQSSIVYVCGYRQFSDMIFDAWLWWRPLQSPITRYCFGDGSGTACPCGNNAPLAGGGCKNHFGASAVLVGQGNPSLANDTFVLRASRMALGSTLFFQGTAQVSGGAGSVFGDGLRCAAGTVIRLGTKSSPAGNAQYPDVSDPTVSVRGQIQAPGTRTYQAWYRDAISYCTPDTFNFTNGLSVIWSP